MRGGTVDDPDCGPAQFGVAVGLSYATPGPVLIIAAYIGYRAEGLAGAVAATVAVFAVPALAALGAASAVQRLSTTRWLPAFGRTAGAAAIGLLAVTLLSLARPVVDVHPALLTGSALGRARGPTGAPAAPAGRGAHRHEALDGRPRRQPKILAASRAGSST